MRLIISDACIGLAEAAAEFFPDAGWQRCTVHFYRNVFSHVPRPKVREAAPLFRLPYTESQTILMVQLLSEQALSAWFNWCRLRDSNTRPHHYE